MNLSPNFTLEELTRSQAALRLGIPNVPNAAQLDNLRRLCHSLLEPARQFAAVAFHVNSGFRCEQVNAAVGSTAKHSAHLDGRAADIIPVGADLRITFDRLRQNPALPIDQIILECNAWIHLAVAPEGMQPRREALLASGGPGAWSYVPAP